MVHASHCVGPNAILQTAVALRHLGGSEMERATLRAAGLERYIATPPEQMIDEAEAASLFRATRMQLDARRADDVLAEAGRLTGAYVAQNRIPAPVGRLLARAPGFISARLLLIAIARNAWTFAGSGHVEIGLGRVLRLSITDNPLATPGCPWHRGAFEELFHRFVSPRSRILHPQCSVRGAPRCVFEFERTRWGAARIFAQHFSYLTSQTEIGDRLIGLLANASVTVRMQAAKSLMQWFWWTRDEALQERIADAFVARMAQPEHPWVRRALRELELRGFILCIERGGGRIGHATLFALRGDRVELRGFGAFSVKNRPARTGRNPRTGTKVEVTEKFIPFFKTGKELRERLNKAVAAESAAAARIERGKGSRT